MAISIFKVTKQLSCLSCFYCCIVVWEKHMHHLLMKCSKNANGKKETKGAKNFWDVLRMKKRHIFHVKR